MKKKLLAVLLALTVACLALPGALAETLQEGEVYTLEEPGLEITMPKGIESCVSGDLVMESLAQELGLTQEEMEEYYNPAQDGIHFWAMSTDTNWEINLEATENSDLVDMRQFSQQELQEILDEVMQDPGDTGFEWEDGSFYQHDQATFIYTAALQADGSRLLRYYTVYDGWSIYWNLISYDGQINPEQEQLLRGLVDNTRFTRESVYEPFSVSGVSWPFLIGFGILMNFLICCLPILLYRFGVRKAPVERKKAWKIIIFYGIAVYLVTNLIFFLIYQGEPVGQAFMPILWCLVDYWVLTKGGKKKAAGPEPSLTRCPQCGEELEEGRRYCPRCGAKVQQEEYKGPEL